MEVRILPGKAGCAAAPDRIGGNLSVTGRGAGDDQGGFLLWEIQTLLFSENFLLETKLLLNLFHMKNCCVPLAAAQ